MIKYISLLFGILFSFIGFINMFWGNDPYLGLAILGISFFYYFPTLETLRDKISSQIRYLLKLFIGFIILWISLGVGELGNKISLMINYFPNTHITGF